MASKVLRKINAKLKFLFENINSGINISKSKCSFGKRQDDKYYFQLYIRTCFPKSISWTLKNLLLLILFTINIPLSEKHIPNSFVLKTIMQCANSGTFRLWMFFMVFSFKEWFKNQTSKSSNQIYSFLPKFFSEILYRSIAL